MAGEFCWNQTCGRLVPRATNGLPLASSSWVPLVWKPLAWAWAGALATVTTPMDASRANRVATAAEILTFMGTSQESVTGRADGVSPYRPARLPAALVPRRRHHAALSHS